MRQEFFYADVNLAGSPVVGCVCSRCLNGLPLVAEADEVRIDPCRCGYEVSQAGLEVMMAWLADVDYYRAWWACDCEACRACHAQESPYKMLRAFTEGGTQVDLQFSREYMALTKGREPADKKEISMEKSKVSLGSKIRSGFSWVWTDLKVHYKIALYGAIGAGLAFAVQAGIRAILARYVGEAVALDGTDEEPMELGSSELND